MRPKSKKDQQDDRKKRRRKRRHGSEDNNEEAVAEISDSQCIESNIQHQLRSKKIISSISVDPVDVSTHSKSPDKYQISTRKGMVEIVDTNEWKAESAECFESTAKDIDVSKKRPRLGSAKRLNMAKKKQKLSGNVDKFDDMSDEEQGRQRITEDDGDCNDIWSEETDKQVSDGSLKLFNRPTVLKTDEGVLMILPHPSEICLKGKCQVTSLCGKVSILGYHVTPKSGSCDFYSPECNSLLTIETIEDETEKAVSNVYDKYLSDVNRTTLPTKGVILLLKWLHSPACDYISRLHLYQQLFSVSEYSKNNSIESELLERVGVALATETDNVPYIRISEDYQFVADKWKKFITKDSAPVIVVCGGKNSGKSTMNRFLLNTSLNIMDRVCYLECDVGQTEFTPQGCVALHIVEEPLLGPPFTHQRHASYMCYFGGSSPADDPDFYLQCLRKCYKYYIDMDVKLPLVVNTMGWNRGLGLDLMVDTLQMINPDIILQLDCNNQTLNFPALSVDFVASELGWTSKSQTFSKDVKEKHGGKDHELIIIESMGNQQQSYTKWSALEHRNLAILSYLNQGLEQGLALTSVPPYILPWNTVGIHVIQEVVPRSQIMYALNASIVALCHADLHQAWRDDEDSPWWFKQVPDARCIGFGIVRGIDPDNKQIYIVTPLSPLQLKQVNTIIRGSINIPEQVLYKQKSSVDLPYVDSMISSTGASALRQRRHMPRKYNPEFT